MQAPAASSSVLQSFGLHLSAFAAWQFTLARYSSSQPFVCTDEQNPSQSVTGASQSVLRDPEAAGEGASVMSRLCPKQPAATTATMAAGTAQRRILPSRRERWRPSWSPRELISVRPHSFLG